jgi:hypothetical protein
MSKELFEAASKTLWEKMEADGVRGIMRYKPFSDQYWDEKYRIVLCNYECIGFQDSQVNDITFDGFRAWIENKKSKTVHYTAVFANALLKTMSANKLIDIKEMRKSYNDIDILHESMRNMMYMNIRPTSGTGSFMDKSTTRKLIVQYKDELKAYLKSLDADIFILSSADSAGIYNYITNETQFNLLYFDEWKHEPGWASPWPESSGRLIVSIKHFGRFFKYTYYHDKIKRILDQFNTSGLVGERQRKEAQRKSDIAIAQMKAESKMIEWKEMGLLKEGDDKELLMRKLQREFLSGQLTDDE